MLQANSEYIKGNKIVLGRVCPLQQGFKLPKEETCSVSLLRFRLSECINYAESGELVLSPVFTINVVKTKRNFHNLLRRRYQTVFSFKDLYKLTYSLCQT